MTLTRVVGDSNHVVISTGDQNFIEATSFGQTTVNSNNSWGSANEAQYYPFIVTYPIVIARLWWMNGTSVAGNFDLGVYNFSTAGPNSKLISTTPTAQGSSNAVTIVNVTDTIIQPGRYYFGFVGTSTANLLPAWNLTQLQVTAIGVLCEASASPLPSTATPVKPTSTCLKIFYCGLTATAA